MTNYFMLCIIDIALYCISPKKFDWQLLVGWRGVLIKILGMLMISY